MCLNLSSQSTNTIQMMFNVRSKPARITKPSNFHWYMYYVLVSCDNVHSRMDTCTYMYSSAHSCGCVANGRDAMVGLLLLRSPYIQAKLNSRPDIFNVVRSMAITEVTIKQIGQKIIHFSISVIKDIHNLSCLLQLQR